MAAGYVTMALGPHIFYTPVPDRDTPAYNKIMIDSQFTWIAQNRLSRDPAMQFTGPGEESIMIGCKLYPVFFGGVSTMDAMRASGRAGKPLALIRFNPLRDPQGMAGQNLGKFVITRVVRDERLIGSFGIGHEIDFTIELKAYGEDVGTNFANPIVQ